MKKAIAVALFLVAACANEPRTITAPAGGGSVTVAHGNRLVIPLAEQAGYEWVMREPVSRAVFHVAPPADGVRNFTPVTSGRETLSFEQRRPGAETAERTLTYEVTVP